MVVDLVCATHGSLLRMLSDAADRHFEGLGSASRYFSNSLSSKQRRWLKNIDTSFAVLRHITSCSAKNFEHDILQSIKAPMDLDSNGKGDKDNVELNKFDIPDMSSDIARLEALVEDAFEMAATSYATAKKDVDDKVLDSRSQLERALPCLSVADMKVATDAINNMENNIRMQLRSNTRLALNKINGIFKQIDMMRSRQAPPQYLGVTIGKGYKHRPGNRGL
eukprot:TRINITY_DN80707_c0_g1_i1.p1 TRINITY_DN80707_c0_g1~~TRINITY_DN80707_c0_g1_i1.p1  ORF type:complete len:241 (+),score=58.43 TRINITY_DN80707_c0_g1_i1:59-724(+)